MVKFEFSVKTREGQKVDKLMIMGRDRPDAERKLRQMYRQCDVLRCEERMNGSTSRQTVTVEDLLSLISRQH